MVDGEKKWRFLDRIVDRLLHLQVEKQLPINVVLVRPLMQAEQAAGHAKESRLRLSGSASRRLFSHSCAAKLTRSPTGRPA
jgi:hypothetical protein